ncbi:unnamed protein product, partial [Effrenium voratum]
SHLGEAPVLEAVEMAKAALKKDLGEVKPLKLSLPAKEPGPVPPADVLSVVKSLAEEGAGLVPLELAVDTMHKMLKQEPEILASMAPEQGVEELRELLAKQLTEAEGQEVLASQLMVADGAKALEALLWELDEAARRTPQEPREVLVVGCCPEQWSTALDAWQVRHYFPSGECFEVVAVDVAAHVTGRTVAVLLPLYGLATGVPLTQAELARLGHFVDFEAARRRSSGGSLPLALLVDVGLRSLQLDAQAECLPVLRHCRSCALLGDLFGEWSAAPKLLAQFVALGAGLSQYCPRAAPTVALVQRLAAQLPLEPRSLEGLRRRRQILLEALSRAGLQVLGKPRAGGHMLARLPEDIAESEYCEALARHGVPAQQGTLLGCPGCVRLCFSLRFDLLEDSVPLFAQAVQEVRRKTFMVKPQAEPKEHTEPKVPTETAPEVTAVDLARSNEAVAGPEEPSPPEAKAAEAAEAREAGTEPKAEETKAEEPKVEEPKVEPSPEAQVPPEEEDAEEEDEEEQEESVAEESADAGDDEDLAVDEAALAAAQQRGFPSDTTFLITHLCLVQLPFWASSQDNQVTLALKAPQLSTRMRAVGGAAPLQAAEAMQSFWSCFDALPQVARDNRKLIGCTAHARNTALDLLIQGHSVVALCADLVLLREGAHRHANEMKTERAGAGTRHWAAPLESQRARLATSALVSQLRRHKKALAAFLHLGDALAAENLCMAGFEAVVLDHEQGPGDLLNAVGLVHAASSAGTHPLLRVPSNDPAYLRRALQLGVEGLILPMTESASQAEDFIAAVKKSFPSSSLRGAGGTAAALRSAAPQAAQFLRRREELLLKAVQVETEAGLAAVKDIAKVDGLDMVFFAPVELAASAPRGQEAGLLLALETAEAEVKRAKKLLGGMLVPGRSAEQMFSAGYDLVCTTSDVILIRAAAENIVRESKPPATGPKAGLVQWVTSAREAKFARNEETLVMRLKKSRQARALAVMARLGSARAAELVASSGFEVVVLDHAKGAEDLLGAVGLIHGAARAGAHTLLRVPALSRSHLRRALQIGVEGVILPGVETPEEAHALVELCLYPSRRICGRTATPPRRA